MKAYNNGWVNRNWYGVRPSSLSFARGSYAMLSLTVNYGAYTANAKVIAENS